MSTEPVCFGISLGGENAVIAVGQPFLRTTSLPCAPSRAPGSLSSAVLATNLYTPESLAPRVEISANESGDRTTPIYAAFVQGEIVLGGDAKAAKIRNPLQTLHCLVPLLSEVHVTNNQYGSLVNADVSVNDRGETVTSANSDGDDESTAPVEISSLLTNFLGLLRKQCIHAAGGRPVGTSVLCIPRHCDPALVLPCAEAAGFDQADLQVIFSDSAAAIAYGIAAAVAPSALEAPPSGTLVVDWGATCATVTYFDVAGGTLECKATKHDWSIGGQRIDKELSLLIADNFKRKTKLDATEQGRSMRKLKSAVERAKLTLSVSQTVAIEIESFCDGVDLQDNLSRTKFENLLREKRFTQGITTLINAVLEEVRGRPVSNVVLSGGTTRIPMLQSFLKQFFETHPTAPVGDVRMAMDGDETSAFGAAIQATLLVTTAARGGEGPKAGGQKSSKQQARLSQVNTATLSYDLCIVTNTNAGDFTETKDEEGTAWTSVAFGAMTPVIIRAGSVLPSTVFINVGSAASKSLLLAAHHQSKPAVVGIVGPPIEVPSAVTQVAITAHTNGDVAVHSGVDGAPLGVIHA